MKKAKSYSVVETVHEPKPERKTIFSAKRIISVVVAACFLMVLPPVSGMSSGFAVSHGAAYVTARRPAQPQLISRNEALRIALRHAGVTHQAAHSIEIELRRRGGRQIYEIKFVAGRYQYEYYIDARTGRIINYRQESRRRQQSRMITRDQALRIALQHAGVPRNAARDISIELERRAGRAVYLVEFEAGRYEYRYRIDAHNGRILESSRERENDDRQRRRHRHQQRR